MSIPALALVGVLFLATAGVCCLAIVSHRRITEPAMDRARPEDVPGMLETSGRTLTGLLSTMKLWARRVLPNAPGAGASELPPAGDSAPGNVGRA